MDNVMITGGTGFIGSRLALKHRESGHTTRVFAAVNSKREEAAAASLRAAGVDVQIGNITSSADVRRALAGVTLVYHLAAAQHEAGMPEAYFHAINVQGTKNLFVEAANQRVGKVVHGSTIGVYGEVDGEKPVDESSPVRPDNIYGVTKLEGEQAALAHSGAVNTTVVRISETYGPGDFRLLKMFRGIARGTFPLIGSGQNIHQVIYVGDLIVGLMAAARYQPTGETFLLGGSERLSTLQMVDCIREAVGSRKAVPRLPMAPVELTARLCEAACKPLRLQPPLHRRRLDFFRKTFLLDCSKAERLLDFHPGTDFCAGSIKTASWYREFGYL
jgi:nucleoside-diphosphate-sugar epimerase